MYKSAKSAVISIFLIYSLGLNAQKKGETASWKYGIALYTFNNFSFPEQLAFADSAAMKYVEGFSFGKAGVEITLVLGDFRIKLLHSPGRTLICCCKLHSG